MRDFADTDFVFDFTVQPSEKAMPGSMAYELDDGDLLIEGTGLNFELDRQDESFEYNDLLQSSLDKFVAAGGPLCYAHKRDHVLGKVLSAKAVPGVGVQIQARVDHQPESSPLRYLYEQIKKGTINCLSGAGIFQRRNTSSGPRICGADWVEWSATATPVGRGTSFAVVAGKALADLAPAPAPDYSGLTEALTGLTRTFDALECKAAKGDPSDLRFLSMLLELEKVTNGMISGAQANDGLPENMDKSDQEVDALASRVKNYLDKVAREAHALAAKLGPLPAVGWQSGM